MGHPVERVVDSIGEVSADWFTLHCCVVGPKVPGTVKTAHSFIGCYVERIITSLTPSYALLGDVICIEQDRPRTHFNTLMSDVVGIVSVCTVPISHTKILDIVTVEVERIG